MQDPNQQGCEPNQQGGYEPEEGLLAKVNALSEKRWNLVQVVFGAALGIAASLALFVLQGFQEFGSAGLLIALLAALVVPRLLERKLERSIKRGRLALIISLGACLLIYMGIVFIKNGMSFS